MNKEYSTLKIAAHIWCFAGMLLALIISVYIFGSEPGGLVLAFFIIAPCALIAGFPAFAALYLLLGVLKRLPTTLVRKIVLLLFAELVISGLYGTAAALFDGVTGFYGALSPARFFQEAVCYTALLFGCTLPAFAVHLTKLRQYFREAGGKNQGPHFLSTKINTHMESFNQAERLPNRSRSHAPNRTFIKGLITGALILILLIPTVFVSDIVTERQERNEKVVNEVSGSWATAQTISGPYLYIPYKNAAGHLLILPTALHVKGTVTPQERQRSIYKVMLYESVLEGSGSFRFDLPRGIDTAMMQLSDAKICMNLSDLRGIAEQVAIDLDHQRYELAPGVPTLEIDSAGLSAPVTLSALQPTQELTFHFQWKIRGSGQLHFVPLAGNSDFRLQSPWPSPSFDGNAIPVENKVDPKGFSARWMFNKASLPFSTVVTDSHGIKEKTAFGVTILQPVDQYTKTARCLKYAILFIGLTFSLFFIVEVMQKKPVHPVQYVLVGLALVIFYTLLLAISEYIPFDFAYLFASAATVSLISLYAKSHFRTWSTAGLFAGVLGALYAFNYVLISLEDAALLIGSIGLFIVLASVMYASRKINWYPAGTGETGGLVTE